MPLFRLLAFLALALPPALAAPAQSQAQAPAQSQAQAEAPIPAPGKAAGKTGLPLPRFASLVHDEANLRTGPGPNYPIRWVYKRPGLPVRIVDELDDWRLVEDPDGEQGWALARLLSTRRTVMVQGGVQALHRSASEGSRVLLRAEPGVVGGFLGCEAEWCQVEIDRKRGWLPRAAVWGVLDSEGR